MLKNSNTPIQHMMAVKDGKLRFQNAFQGVSRMIKMPSCGLKTPNEYFYAKNFHVFWHVKIIKCRIDSQFLKD
jgi:hypothetical protein